MPFKLQSKINKRKQFINKNLSFFWIGKNITWPIFLDMWNTILFYVLHKLTAGLKSLLHI